LKISTLDPITKELLPKEICKDDTLFVAKDVGVDGSNQSRGLLKGEKRGEKRVVKQISSCPLVQDRSTASGLWSLDWVNRRKQNEFGVPLCWNKMCLTLPFESFDDNKVLKIVNWIC